MKPLIEVRDLSFKYSVEGPLILDCINADIEEGRITAIAGLSGSGKSTLAFCLCGAIPKSLPGIMKGSILLEGRDIKDIPLPNLAEKIGIVFQDVDNQLFLPTVEAEIAFAPENLCLPWDEIKETVERVINTLGIEHLRNKDPRRLSGGEKQLAAVAAVLSLNPQILILDEVFPELDEANRKLMRDTVRMLKASGKTVIIIDHCIDSLMEADCILLLKDGRIEDRIEVDEKNELLYGKLSDFFLSRKGQPF